MRHSCWLLLFIPWGKVASFSTPALPIRRGVGLSSVNPQVASTTDYVSEISPTATLSTNTTEEHQPFLKLGLALQSFNSSEASSLLDDVAKLRKQQQSNGEGDDMNLFLDSLLHSLDSTKLPVWARIKFLARFSKRARLSSLRRTLRHVTPPPSEQEDRMRDAKEEIDDDFQRRRRRALLSLLRTLAAPPQDGFVGCTTTGRQRSIPAIRQIEVKALAEQTASKSTTANTMLQRRPTDLETPKYTVLSGDNNTPADSRGGWFQIRSYEPFRVCTVSLLQERKANPEMDATLNEPAKGNIKAFGALAGYLFGKNQDSKAMKMTTPVLTTEDKRMSFVLPSEYWGDPAAAPQPLVGSGVTVENVEPATRAVVMFGGYAVNVAERKKQLLLLVDNDKEWMVVPGETPVLAQYNDPFTPPWKRLNEVSIAVQKRNGSE